MNTGCDQYTFSYNELKDFLIYAKKIAPVISFQEYDKRHKRCIILRHDIDLDFNPSYNISKIEKNLGVNSTFFILLTSYSYNPQSAKIRTLLMEMVDDGFEIGLHFDPSVYGNIGEKELQQKVDMECKILSSIIDKTVRSISLHNPSISGKYPLFKGYINACSKEFFSDKRYISDSMRVDPTLHPFRGKDIKTFIESATKYPLQVTLHPEQFFENGGDYIDTLASYNGRMMNNIMHDYFNTISIIKKRQLWRIK